MTATAEQPPADTRNSAGEWLGFIWRWIWVPLAALAAGAAIKFVVLAPVSWTEALDGIVATIAGQSDWPTAIGGIRGIVYEYGRRFEIASWIVSALGGLLFGFLALATIFILRFREQVTQMTSLQRQIRSTFANLEQHIENLESRHNVIQGGTEFGRVLALRSFKNQDLEDGDDWYSTQFEQQPYCVTSTLILDRAEELLTSEQYMRFFVDPDLPDLGYFRLVLAREPKDYEGLCAFAAVSKAVKYQSVFLPRRWWKEHLRPALRQQLSSATFDALEHLIDRNTELAIKGVSTEELRSANVTAYCGRIAKLERDRTANSTIWRFWNGHHEDVREITPEAVEIYARLLGLLKQFRQEPDEFDRDYFANLFGGSYFRTLTDDVCRNLAASQRATTTSNP